MFISFMWGDGKSMAQVRKQKVGSKYAYMPKQVPTSFAGTAISNKYLLNEEMNEPFWTLSFFLCK